MRARRSGSGGARPPGSFVPRRRGVEAAVSRNRTAQESGEEAMSSVLAGLVRAGGAVAMTLLVTGCGGSSSSDAVSTALQMPGVRTVVVPKQHNDLTVMVPPCSVAAVSQTGASGPPPGSNTVVVPKGTLTQTVAIQ